ncbi:MAG: caspase family protein [Actinoplanes sp.]
MELSDPAASRAVLIGVHSYTDLPNLPAVGRNLAGLREAIAHPEIWGLPAEHCLVVAQPDNARAVLDAVIAAGSGATDTLLVYYAGHGLTDPHNDELYLTLPGSDPEYPAMALAYEFLRRAVRDPRIKARRKVVILDCCYSGRALEGGMGDVLANRTVTAGTHVLTASGATQRAWSPPGEVYTAFTGELLRLLDQGIPDGPELLSADTIYQHVHTELMAKGRPLPQQHNRNAGGDIVLARNRAVGGTTPTPLPVPTLPRRYWPPPAWAKLVLIFVTVLAVVATVAWMVNRQQDRVAVGTSPIPVSLTDCYFADAVQPGADKAYSCTAPGNRDAVVDVYPDRKTLDAAYERAIGDADVPAGTGDCASEQNAEHRYPVTGPAQGRVLCWTVDTTTKLVWTDYAARAVSRVEAPAGDLRALRDSWAVPAPAFPTPDEKELIDMPVATECVRAGVEEIDDFPGALAGVRCAGTGGAGAQSVSYFRFGSEAQLSAAVNGHIPAGKDPAAAGCQDGKAPRFTGGSRYDLRGVSLGLLLCYPAEDGNLVMEWSVEALLVAGRAVGNDAKDLASWWRIDRGPPIRTTVDAINKGNGFPDAGEQALLNRIPTVSRQLCMRPSGEFRTEHTGASRVKAGVVCGPRIGPPIAFYYQFEDLAEMRQNYAPLGQPEGRCLASPTAVVGESAYSRGGATGRLRCENRDGNLVRIWTDERRLIQAFAFQGHSAESMSDWWEHDAGPL